MTPAAIREQFFSVLNDTEKNISAFVKNPGSDMSRHRACSFSAVKRRIWTELFFW